MVVIISLTYVSIMGHVVNVEQFIGFEIMVVAYVKTMNIKISSWGFFIKERLLFKRLGLWVLYM